MIVSRGETFNLELYKRKPNSDYEFEEQPLLIFKGKPANNMEKKLFRIIKGVEGDSSNVFIYATNLPKQVEIKDKIKFLGKYWQVMSIGYYFESSLFVNAGIMKDDYIMERSPKGIILG